MTQPFLDGGRATRPGPRRHGGTAAAALAAVTVVGSLVLVGCEAGGSPPLVAGPPSASPSSSAALPAGSIIAASAEHPVLAIQGDTVSVTTPAGHVLATVVGPAVPPFVAPPPPSVTATFTVTLASAGGVVPVRLQDFTIRDQNGRLLHPLLPTGSAPPPATAPGTSVDFRLTAVLPVGEGQLQWAPAGRTVTRWDFVVEND